MEEGQLFGQHNPVFGAFVKSEGRKFRNFHNGNVSGQIDKGISLCILQARTSKKDFIKYLIKVDISDEGEVLIGFPQCVRGLRKQNCRLDGGDISRKGNSTMDERSYSFSQSTGSRTVCTRGRAVQKRRRHLLQPCCDRREVTYGRPWNGPHKRPDGPL